MSEWATIESAPKDGTDFLAWAVCETSGVGWVSIARRWRDGYLSEDDGTVGPTHWMPLPEPPKQKE